MSEFGGVPIHHAHGLVDFGQEIAEEVEELFGDREHELPDEIARGIPHDLPVVRVRQVQPSKGHYRTFTLDGANAQEVSPPYPNRFGLRVRCVSGGPVFVSGDNTTPVGGSAQSYSLANGAELPVTHTDKVFVNGPANAIVSVYAEYLPGAD